MRRKGLGAMLAGVLLLTAGSLEAQVSWEAPLMVAPSTPNGWGVYLVDPAPSGGIGVSSTWRTGSGLGYRAGLAEDAGGSFSVFGGIDVSGRLVEHSDDFPLDVHWVTGAGFGVGDAFLLSFPVGASFGREAQVDEVWFNPYVTPRVVLDAYIGGDSPDDDRLSLGVVVDLGVDVSFDRGWAVRFAGSLGSRNRNALAIGLSFRVL